MGNVPENIYAHKLFPITCLYIYIYLCRMITKGGEK